MLNESMDFIVTTSNSLIVPILWPPHKFKSFQKSYYCSCLQEDNYRFHTSLTEKNINENQKLCFSVNKSLLRFTPTMLFTFRYEVEQRSYSTNNIHQEWLFVRLTMTHLRTVKHRQHLRCTFV